MGRFPLSPALAAVVLAGAVSAAPPQAPHFPGAATSVAVERPGGRIAVARGGRVEVFASLDATRPTTAFELPSESSRLLEFRGGVIVFSFTMKKDERTQYMAIGADGAERLLWPNDGIGETFPAEGTRLTLDGKGVYGFLALSPKVRAELSVPNDVADGAGVAVTYKFSTEKMLIRFSDAFRDAVAIACDDLLLTWRDGTAIRYRSPGGVVWKRDYLTGPGARILDVDTGVGGELLLDEKGAVTVAAIGDGAPRWQRAPGVGETIHDGRLLADGRALLLVGGERPGLVVASDRGGKDVFAALETQGLGALAAYVRDHAVDLGEIWEVAGEGGSKLLLRGADGWYLGELP